MLPIMRRVHRRQVPMSIPASYSRFNATLSIGPIRSQNIDQLAGVGIQLHRLRHIRAHLLPRRDETVLSGLHISAALCDIIYAAACAVRVESACSRTP